MLFLLTFYSEPKQQNPNKDQPHKCVHKNLGNDDFPFQTFLSWQEHNCNGIKKIQSFFFKYLYHL